MHRLLLGKLADTEMSSSLALQADLGLLLSTSLGVGSIRLSRRVDVELGPFVSLGSSLGVRLLDLQLLGQSLLVGDDLCVRSLGTLKLLVCLVLLLGALVQTLSGRMVKRQAEEPRSAIENSATTNSPCLALPMQTHLDRLLFSLLGLGSSLLRRLCISQRVRHGLLLILLLLLQQLLKLLLFAR